MCNLYSLTRPQSEIGKAFSIERDDTGNLPPLPGIFPNTTAPGDPHAQRCPCPVDDALGHAFARLCAEW